MTATRIGYARCSTDKQDLAAQRAMLEALGVAPERIDMDRGLTGTTRARPGLDHVFGKGDAGARGRPGTAAAGGPAGRNAQRQARQPAE